MFGLTLSKELTASGVAHEVVSVETALLPGLVGALRHVGDIKATIRPGRAGGR